MRALLTALFLLAIFLVLGYALFDRPHEFSEDDCRGCHRSVPKQTDKSPLPMIGKIKTLCARCHSRVIRAYSHPDEVVPIKAVVPADMPMSTDGKITCATCHDIHSVLEWSKRVHLLRRPVTGSEFCAGCHIERLGSIQHSDSLGFAHNAGAKYIPKQGVGSLDRISVQCMSCHDSSIGKGNSVTYVGFWSHSRELSEHLGAHPIGVNYDEARMRSPGGFNPKFSIAPLKLFNGNIGCGSCHDPYSMLPNKLIVTNNRLCTKCHIK